MAFSSASQSNHSPSETELFLLSAADRSALIERAKEFRSLCEQQPQANLTEWAISLNTGPPEAVRLAIVAKSVLDLAEKLKRASDRLVDPECRQIRDVNGIYFFENPLAEAGKVAMLFPGEGAPYLGMIGDLPGRFPVVANVVDECDQLSRGQGNAPLSRFLAVPESDAERAELDRELRGLGNTMFSVLMVDWALWDLFSSLGIKPDAVAGHSAGELAALWVSGSLIGRLDMPKLRQTMDFLEADELAAGTESVLLAVGASRETMLELLAQVTAEFGYPADASPMFLAMDNCPHQTVVIGPPDAMQSVAETLRERKIMHERLPFNRPYHTPLFEPQMGPLASMFDDMQFQAPQTTLYSCTTEKPFPQEPAAIRELAMSQWILPVEFSRMIRNMHDDGVKIFLELGPRGNVTSFVSDILRGREFLAISADVQRHSGVTQLHHVLGQLFAHHVPMRIEALYPGQTSQQTAAQESEPMQQTAAGEAWPIAPRSHSPNGRAGVVNEHWNVMGEFLDLQEDVMRQFLHLRQSGVSRRQSSSNSQEMPFGSMESAGRQTSPEPVAQGSPPQHQLPLIGQIVRSIPGQELVARRCLDVEEDIYGDHHTVGGREVSYVQPERNGQPVVPMTFSLEMLAEAATLAVPGLVVTAIRNVQLAKWLVFDEDHPHTIELTARVRQYDGQSATLEMRIFDLGFELDRPDHKGDLAAVATVEMADRYPAPPPVEDFPLTGERPCRIPLDVLYKNLFHGEYFQGVMSLDRYGEEGIQSQIRVLPRDGLFRSDPDPQFVLDPVLMDVAMHPLAGWHLEQPDQSGRILLPYELGDIRFYGPRPAVDTEMTSRGRTVHESSRRFTHSVEVVGPHNRIWCTMDKLKYWRFYLPFGEYNFHGPKEDYYLSENWPEAIGEDFDANEPSAWCVGLMPPRDLQTPGMMLASARVALTEEEVRTFRKLDLPDPRKAQWLFGRMAAKDAARILWRKRTGEAMVPADIAINPDEYGKPVASPIGRDRPEDYPQVSIAHTDGVVAALGAFDRSPGIDLERIAAREESFVKAAFDKSEQELISAAAMDRDETVTRFWCAKEAVSKALGQGLVEGPQSLEVTAFDPAGGTVTVEISPRLAERLPMEMEGPLEVRTVRKDDFVIATILLESQYLCPAATTTSSEKLPAS